MQNNDKLAKDVLATKYADMVRGLKITPQQDAELKKLYRRATMPVRPWAYVFGGATLAEVAGSAYVLMRYLENNDNNMVTWWAAFMVAQMIAMCALGYRMQSAEKQLNKNIRKIKAQNLVQNVR